MEKLRLSLIFALRYENDEKVYKLKELLKKAGLAEQQVKIIDCLIEYAGKAKRTGDLFQNKDLFSKGTKIFKSYFKEVQNVLLQHKPLLMTQLDNLFKGKLSPQDYPATQSIDYRDKPTNVIVFVVGGVTFEEAKEIAITYNQQSVILISINQMFYLYRNQSQSSSRWNLYSQYENLPCRCVLDRNDQGINCQF